MTQFSRYRRKLRTEVLENRLTPAAGTYVEDFTNDVQTIFAGYDSARDGVQIAVRREATHGNNLLATPQGGPAGRHSLFLHTNPVLPVAQYTAAPFHSSQPGGLAPWDRIRAASVTFRGEGTITFNGQNPITFTNTAPPDQWVTFRVTAASEGPQGQPLGDITSIQVATTSEMWVDDVTMEIESDPTAVQAEPSVVRVFRFGTGMGIVGDARNNFVRVDVQYDDTRAIRVTGLADTQIRAGSPDVVQISSNEVLVPDFLWEVEIGDDYLPVPHDDRDLLINLNGGDDLLQIVGSDWNSYDSPFLDDLLINTGGGESIVEIDNVLLQDALSYLSGAAVDVLSIFGASRARALQVSTGGGDDIVRIGEPGPAVYDGDPPTKIVMGHFHYNPHDVYTGRSFINTGGGADSVALRGGMYHDVSVILGAGSDKFALESSKCSGLMVSTGAGADQMTFKDIESRGIELRFADRFDVLRIDRVRDGGFRQTGNQRFLVELPANGTAVHAFADDQQDELMPGMPTNRLRDSIIELFGNVGVWGLITDVRFAATDF